MFKVELSFIPEIPEDWEKKKKKKKDGATKHML